MHPALSIIAFTTLSGLGYGLAAVLGLGMLDASAIATRLAHVLALAIITAGLLSSTLHLGNPQRAWRAFSQWRTSWLSREGVMAVVTFLPLVCSAWASVIDGRYLALPGLLGTALALVTVVCTAMIYASLKSVDAWHTPLTPACFVLFAISGGLLLAAFFAAVGGGAPRALALCAALALVAAWATKLAWRHRMNTLVPLSTTASATQLGNLGRVRLFERPHTNENYLTREMGFRVARKHARKLAVVSLTAGGVLPALIALGVGLAGATGWAAALLLAVAALSHVLGMLVERWLFFAEARHAVSSWYGG